MQVVSILILNSIRMTKFNLCLLVLACCVLGSLSLTLRQRSLRKYCPPKPPTVTELNATRVIFSFVVYGRGGQTFWTAGQILRKNSYAGRKKIYHTKFRLDFFHFKPKRDYFSMFAYKIMSKNLLKVLL